MDAIEGLRLAGAECVILGCTEIPLIVTSANSPLPVLDSTRLLAKVAVEEALSDRPVPVKAGWLDVAGSAGTRPGGAVARTRSSDGTG